MNYCLKNNSPTTTTGVLDPTSRLTLGLKINTSLGGSMQYSNNTLPFVSNFGRLPHHFYSKIKLANPHFNPTWIHINDGIAQRFGLSRTDLQSGEWLDYLSGTRMIRNGDYIATVYSGHQFGQWAGQLGDGRAVLMGQVNDSQGDSWDIQLKGAGLTPYSRFADGRAVLRSSIREYLCSAAMDALGVPTTDALGIAKTGETVYRETPEPGAVITRVARSHIRFGHFEHFYYTNDLSSLHVLTDHVRHLYFPNCKTNVEWFGAVCERTAHLIAKWQSIGFCHGVMNTDNMSILGLTLDYGPFGFMDAFDPSHICNHSDYYGRYAFDQQPAIAKWNLAALGHALSPILPRSESQPILAQFDTMFSSHYAQLMRQKIGALPDDNSADELWIDLLTLMASKRADYTLSFRYLDDPAQWLPLYQNDPIAQDWHSKFIQFHTTSSHDWRAQLNRVNPIVTLRNWVAETAIRAVEDHNDLAEFEAIFTAITHPFSETDVSHRYSSPPPPSMCNLEISCSS